MSREVKGFSWLWRGRCDEKNEGRWNGEHKNDCNEESHFVSECQHPISSEQIKLFQNKRKEKIKIKMCYLVFIMFCHLR